MKKILSLVLIMASPLVFACEESIQSFGGPVTDGGSPSEPQFGAMSDNSGIGQIQCIELPPIQAVITYIPMANWLGGSYGLAYALSYSGVGGGTILPNVNLTTIDGCDSSTPQERIAAAQSAFTDTGSEMHNLIIEHGPYSPQGRAATRWLNIHAEGNLYVFGFYDTTRGFYRIGPNNTLTSEESCG